MNKLMLPLVALLMAAGFGTAGDEEKDLKKLVGTWEEVSHVANGKAKPAAEVKGHTVVIDSAGKRLRRNGSPCLRDAATAPWATMIGVIRASLGTLRSAFILRIAVIACCQ